MSEYPYAEHHVQDIDNGGTVGWLWHIDAEHSVWCGEISRNRFDEMSEEAREAMGDDFGWFLVLYGKRSAAVLGKALNEYQGRDLAEAIALGLTANPTRINGLMNGDDGA